MFAAGEAWTEEYVVVVSDDVQRDEVSTAELRRMYLFRSRFWGANRPVQLLLTEPNMQDDSFLLSEILAMDHPSFRRLIIEKMYQGVLDLAPKIVASDELAIDFVRAGSGLMAIVSAEAAEEGPVKVLSVDGAPPGSEDYPLRR